MSSTIPGQQATRRALKRIPNMAGATVVALLSDGPSNRSYRVEHQGQSYVLRLDKPEAISLGLNRENEKQVSRVVAAVGLAPGHLYFEPGEGISFRRFIPGRSWVTSDLDSRENLDRLAVLLRKLHRIEPVGVTFEPLAAASRYANQLGTRESRSIFAELEHFYEIIHAGSARQVICHNDLLCQNIFEGYHLMLIDWEYTGVGDPFFDLAVVVQHHELEQGAAVAFLESYLQHPATPWEIKHLKLQCSFYAHLLQLWHQLHPR